jgi:hypothetical protein
MRGALFLLSSKDPPLIAVVTRCGYSGHDPIGTSATVRWATVRQVSMKFLCVSIRKVSYSR